MRKFITGPALGAWLAVVANPALAADAALEIKTAAAHAGFAAASNTLKTVHMHLHHAINCLEGSKGADFDAKSGDPCKGQGAGAIPDSPPDKRGTLEAIVHQAKMALAEQDLAKAKEMAGAAQKSLSQ